jgi:hypothetical protein
VLPISTPLDLLNRPTHAVLLSLHSWEIRLRDLNWHCFLQWSYVRIHFPPEWRPLTVFCSMRLQVAHRSGPHETCIKERINERC